MKRIILMIFVVVLALTAAAEGAVIGNMTRLRLEQGRVARMSQLHKATSDEDEYPYMPLMLAVAGEDVVAQLEALGVIIYHRRDELLLTSVPADALDEVLALEGVIEASASGDMSSNLDMARPYGYVDDLHTAGADGSGYTGRGVVMGFADIGFDAGHIAFKDAVSAIYDYRTLYGERTAVTTPASIAEWTTDNPEEYHATHVGNIMCGRYKGNGYYGIAPGAELVVTTSDLSDVGLLSGIEDIIAYAKEAGKPAVVNMSMSNYLGPHDGTDMLCRYLSRMAKDATICISAGNSGGQTNFATHQFTPEHPVANVIYNTYQGYNGFEVKGWSEVWSLSAEAVEYRIEVYDIDNKQIMWASEWQQDKYSVDTDSEPEFGRYIDGEVKALGGVSATNGKYNIAFSYNLKTEQQSSRGPWSKYYLSISVRGIEGERVNLYSDGVYSYMGRGIDVGTTIGADGSINDMCTAEGIVACGACSSRNTAPNIADEYTQWSFAVEQVAKFSSYSHTPGIKPLPHLCAPGNYVVSALSRYYHEIDPDVRVAATCNVDGTEYEWWACCGTSMSSPYIAGVFALWLEANPHLTPAELLKIATTTARRDFVDIDNPRWGAGCIDARAGLSMIMNSSGVEGVKALDAEPMELRVNADRSLSINLSASARVYNTEGKMVDYTCPLPCGLYIVNVPGYSSRKIIIR